MAAIINRTPTGRLISLHAEVKYLNARFGSKSFELKGLKYDADSEFNPLMYFSLKKNHPSIGEYDPYLNNPLSPAKFHLTQSIQYDTQKSKSASECLNALEALGWVERTGNVSKLTSVGTRLASIDYGNGEFLKIARESVLGYGVFVGFLYKCLINQSEQDIVTKSKIKIGYQNTYETTHNGDRKIPLSTGSQKDTIVRTRSTLFAWAVTTGFSFPSDLQVPSKPSSWHVVALEEIKKRHWGWSKLRMFIPESLFISNFLVRRPLSYHWMTKSTKALRERGQKTIRESSLGLEGKIKNRRFAIVFSLALAADENKSINYPRLLNKLLKHSGLFVVSGKDFSRVMDIESDIAIVAGIPFSRKNDVLTPLTRLDYQALTEGAPEKVIRTTKEAYNASKI